MKRTGAPSEVFSHSEVSSGLLFNFASDRHPSLVLGWDGSEIDVPSGSTHFGYVATGQLELCCASGSFVLQAGMYFVVPGAAKLSGGSGVIISTSSFTGLFQIGGPLESAGRLRYIDGCSDTLLVAPPMLGDPCLNLLHIPPLTSQTEHTHPSIRIGIVVDGWGICKTPEGDTHLKPGLVFAIQTDGRHSFHTKDSPLRIVAWHPDSDCGPTHEQHPMLNRTFVDGQPVNQGGRE